MKLRRKCLARADGKRIGRLSRQPIHVSSSEAQSQTTARKGTRFSVNKNPAELSASLRVCDCPSVSVPLDGASEWGCRLALYADLVPPAPGCRALCVYDAVIAFIASLKDRPSTLTAEIPSCHRRGKPQSHLHHEYR